MTIRKFLVFFMSLSFVLLLVGIFGYQYYRSYESLDFMEKIEDSYRYVKTENDEILLYDHNKKWEPLDIRGIELSSFKPKSNLNDNKISKDEVLEWLVQIQALNINVIKIPSIQTPSFYKAIYEFNQDNPKPIYTFHRIDLNEKEFLDYHDIGNPKLFNRFQKDIKRTVKVVHGDAFLINTSNGSMGFYLNDISKYNLGYILGGNTDAELISLTNHKYNTASHFDGEYYNLQDGEAFDAFVSNAFEFLTHYENKHYKQISLLSYVSQFETHVLDDSLKVDYAKDARINLNKISSKKFENLFIAYHYHPSDSDDSVKGPDYSAIRETYSEHLSRLKLNYKKPIVITNVGISSSRGKSLLDLEENYHRGGFTETEQGEKLVEVLQIIDKADLGGFIITGWQDNWGKKSPFNMLEDKRDWSSSTYWRNTLASDESFGLMAFEPKNLKEPITIDGNFSDWQNVTAIMDHDLDLKVSSDTDHLYIYLKNDSDLQNNALYLGIDVTEKSGSRKWLNKAAEFYLPVDFVLDLSNILEPEVFVHERYDHFEYFYKYYDAVAGVRKHKPDKNSQVFSPILGMNQKRARNLEPGEKKSLFYNIGKLNMGNSNYLSKDYNSHADFNQVGNEIEIRIPYAMLNIFNPIDMFAYDDLYEAGLENHIKVDDIGFSIYDAQTQKKYNASDRYKQKSFKNLEYTTRLKPSYGILQAYLKTK